jgi:hypothetical protein
MGKRGGLSSQEGEQGSAKIWGFQNQTAQVGGRKATVRDHKTGLSVQAREMQPVSHSQGDSKR